MEESAASPALSSSSGSEGVTRGIQHVLLEESSSSPQEGAVSGESATVLNRRNADERSSTEFTQKPTAAAGNTPKVPDQSTELNSASSKLLMAVHKEFTITSTGPAATNVATLQQPSVETETADRKLPPIQANSAETKDMSILSNSSSSKPRKKKRSSALVEGQTTGRWTEAEHQAFLRGLQTYGREWKKVASHIPTRTSAQVRSHAQKYFAKLQRDEESWALQNAAAALGGGDRMMMPADSSSTAISDGTHEHRHLPPSVQGNVARILAEPESVQAEVEDTLRQLRERYRQLQSRLHQSELRNKRTREGVADDHSSSATSISSLQNEELIALSVLHGGLPHSNANASMSAEEEEKGGNEEKDGHDTDESSAKRPRHEN